MLTLDLRKPVADPLILGVQETYPGKWTHQIRVLDESVIEHVVNEGWLEAAYDFGIKDPK